LLLCFTGFSRTASEIAIKQISKIRENKRILNDISSLTSEALIALTQDKTDIRIFGELLNNQWRLKRELDETVSNDYIDNLYKRGIGAGAMGGKLLGAGAGGFFLFFAEPKFHQNIIDSLKDNMFVPFRFDTTGSTIVYYSND
jgi:D-glycero-alpha-D-manno-heptose-7-phosphate kinase